MEERAKGLIVRTRPWTETSLIVHWFTREQGRLATMAKGARRPKSPFRGRLDLFYLDELVFHRSRRSDLHLLKEVHLLSTHPGLEAEADRLRLACEAVRRLEQVTEPESAIPAVFDLLLGLVQHLNEHPARRRLLLAYEVRLAMALGWDPLRRMGRLSPPARQLLLALRTLDWAELEGLTPTPGAAREVSVFLDELWRLEVGVRGVVPGRGPVRDAPRAGDSGPAGDCGGGL